MKIHRYFKGNSEALGGGSSDNLTASLRLIALFAYHVNGNVDEYAVLIATR
jgi:hypothetical protein